MERRAFFRNITISTGGFVILPGMITGNPVSGEPGYTRYIADTTSFSRVQFPEDKRIPLGWPAFPIEVGNRFSCLMKFKTMKDGMGDFHFRITAAIDVREEVLLGAFLPESGEMVATLDIKYAHPFQPFETPLDKKWISEIKKQGIGLRMIKGTKDVWVFQNGTKQNDYPGLQPQILSGAYPGTKDTFYDNLYSMNSISPFGWMGGCVTDALLEMSRNGDQKASLNLKRQLACFLHDEKGIIFENPNTIPLVGTFNSIEDFLPFAAIASLYPGHPSVQMAIDYCLARMKPDGLIANSDHVTTEGCYTLAYPLAQISVIREDRELAEIALKQLVHRIHFLASDHALFQRNDLGRGTGFKNWGRGIVWYLLGMGKTINLIENSAFANLPQLEDIKKEFVRTIKWVCQFQKEDGMWCSFADNPETLTDTSASAGIATALAWGVYLKLLPESDIPKAERTMKSLLSYLTADGFLTNASQINRGGEELQSNGYRVISQFAMGLMAQLDSRLILLNHF